MYPEIQKTFMIRIYFIIKFYLTESLNKEKNHLTVILS